MALILGIDEAGKGPVIGPLVLVGTLIEESDLPKLEKLGVKDSKLLTPKKREYLFEKIKLVVKRYKVVKISPKEIDEALESDSLNLNWLEACKEAEIINELKPDKAIIDCPSPNIKAYTDYLLNLLTDKKVKLIVEHKADVKYPIVSAASIIAKCVREEEVKKIEKEIGMSIGSGYPSNKVCQKFIKENFEKYPEIFRKTWTTYKRLVNGKKQKKLDEF